MSGRNGIRGLGKSTPGRTKGFIEEGRVLCITNTYNIILYRTDLLTETKTRISLFGELEMGSQGSWLCFTVLFLILQQVYTGHIVCM
jgi:hypothetical protein